MGRLLFHLIIPALVAAGALWSATHLAAFSLDAFLVYGVLGFLYYSAPHLLWAAVAALGKASAVVCHVGFIAANLVLLAIASVSFAGVRDPSGLPLQWAAYWPAALLLQAVFIAVAAAIRRSNAGVGA